MDALPNQKAEIIQKRTEMRRLGYPPPNNYSLYILRTVGQVVSVEHRETLESILNSEIERSVEQLNKKYTRKELEDVDSKSYSSEQISPHDQVCLMELLIICKEVDLKVDIFEY